MGAHRRTVAQKNKLDLHINNLQRNKRFGEVTRVVEAGEQPHKSRDGHPQNLRLCIGTHLRKSAFGAIISLDSVYHYSFLVYR